MRGWLFFLCSGMVEKVFERPGILATKDGLVIHISHVDDGHRPALTFAQRPPLCEVLAEIGMREDYDSCALGLVSVGGHIGFHGQRVGDARLGKGQRLGQPCLPKVHIAGDRT